MKRFLPFLCLVMLATTLPAAAQQKGPAIEFDSLSKDVAKLVYEGEVVTEVFKFTNKGDATLEIKSVEPGCGCTSAVPTPNKLAPGQSGQIEIKITTAGLTAATAQKSEMSKTVTVTSNDAKNPAVVLTITGTVAPEVSLSVPNIYFGSTPQGREVTKELTAEIAADRQVKILSATSTDPHVTVSLEPTAGNDRQIKVVVVQKASAPVGLHSGEIVLKTNSKLKPEVRFSVRGLVAKSH